MARVAHNQLGLDLVRLMPAGDPWQKDGSEVSGADHRWAMALLLAEEEEWLVADDTEVTRGGPSYTIDTIEPMDERPTLILGADAALGLTSWHRADDLLDMVDIAVVPRDGVSRTSVEDAVGHRITWLDMEPIAVSSSDVRAAVASGGEIAEFVPGSIGEYISEHNLYRPSVSRRSKPLSSSRMKKAHAGATQDAITAARAAAQAITEKSGENLVLLDLSNLLVVTDIFVLATGSSRRNVLSLVDEAVAALRKLDREPIRREGTDHGQWVLLDYGDIVIHVFNQETREYYDLERLWADAPRIEFEPSPSITVP